MRRFHGPKDYLDAARDASATGDDLARLAECGYDFVALAVAAHPATFGDTLPSLLDKFRPDSWNEAELLRLLANHANASASLLAEIAARIPALLHRRDRQNGFAAGVALFRRPDTSIELLSALLSHPDTTTEFRKVVARETNRRDVVNLLERDRSERVREAAVNNTA